MFFYAGHAIQVNGKNYPGPHRHQARDLEEPDVDFETIPRRSSRASDGARGSHDHCCSSTPAATTRSHAQPRGVSRVALGRTRARVSPRKSCPRPARSSRSLPIPGNVALDGKGRNSPFAKALVANIRRPGVEISTMMTDVRVQVREETNNAQTPWTNSSLLGHFYFNPLPTGSTGDQVAAADSSAQSNNAAAAPPLSGGGNASAGKVDDARVAALAWDSVKDTDSQDALEFFISKFGDTFYGGLAQLRLNRLKAAAGDSGAKPEATADTSTKGEQAIQPEQTAETPRKRRPSRRPRSPASSRRKAPAASNRPSTCARLPARSRRGWRGSIAIPVLRTASGESAPRARSTISRAPPRSSSLRWSQVPIC